MRSSARRSVTAAPRGSAATIAGGRGRVQPIGGYARRIADDRPAIHSGNCAAMTRVEAGQQITPSLKLVRKVGGGAMGYVWAAENLALPMWGGIEAEQQERVVEAVRSAVGVPA